MVWQEISFLWLLLIIPILVLLVRWRKKFLQNIQDQYFNKTLFESLRIGFWETGNTVKTVLILFGFICVILSLAGPKIGTEVREVKRKGVEMLIALDLSASMNAEDVRPSRLDKAKFEIRGLIDRLKGDRVGLVVFTGEAYLQSPMTLDYSALLLFLEIVDTDQMPSSATDFNAAMKTSLDAFNSLEENTTNAAKVLLIISDGEDHGQSYSGSLEELVNSNVSVFTLGIGTEQGTTIPLYEEKTGQIIGYKRDRDGRVVTTSLESKTLREIASSSGGSYYSIERGNDGIDAFLARIDDLEQGEFSSQEYADFKNQYQWLAAMALVCFISAVLFPNFRAK